MELLEPESVVERLEDLVHLDTQRAANGIDLTAGAVYRLDEPGRLDFGGGEFAEAAGSRLEPERKSPDDDYGWWNLNPGLYRIDFNEEFAAQEGEFGIIRPLPRLLAAGATHPTFEIDEDSELGVVVQVGPQGVEMKENFRVSRLQVYRRS